MTEKFALNISPERQVPALLRSTPAQVAAMPKQSTPWLTTGRAGLSKKLLNSSLLATTLAQIESVGGWHWPSKPICFISDLHADANALVRSLQGVGLISNSNSISLLPHRKFLSTEFIIGGDCLDKGPSNFALLDKLGELRSHGVKPKIIAGNHDLRLLFGLLSLSAHQPCDKHFFVRMMPKVLPLFKEALSLPEAKQMICSNVPSEATCKKHFLPDLQWQQSFSEQMKSTLTSQAIDKEIKRTNKKIKSLPDELAHFGFTFKDLYVASKLCEQLFIQPDGRYHWFFRDMQLIEHQKSFVFVHAGLCNEVADLLITEGSDQINTRFKQAIQRGSQLSLSELYFGPLFNTVRTKYRETDHALDTAQADNLYRHGVHAVVHGHRSRTQGQRLAMRRKLIHFEADITLDINSREAEGLKGPGAGALLIQPEGIVEGHSVDYPMIKQFRPADWH